jgi:glucans biosynthesis protein C
MGRTFAGLWSLSPRRSRVQASGELRDRTPEAAPSERVHYLDWLKVLIVFGIFIFHVSLVFATPTWLVSNAQRSRVLTGFAAFAFPWGIPAMFFIAGANSWFGLRSRSAAKFLHGRFLRLVVPLAAGMVLLSPLQRFVTSHNPPPPIERLPAFYLDYFQTTQVEWTPVWLSQYSLHLWFLGYLFAISLVCLPALTWLRGGAGRRLVASLVRFSRRRGAIFIFAVPIALSQLALRSRFPAYQDWADIATYTLVFILGAVIAADRGFEPAIRRDVRLALGLGVVASIGIGMLVVIDAQRIPMSVAAVALHDIAYALLWSLNIWSWLLTVLYLGIRWLDVPNRVVDYASESVLPFYVIHHPVVLVVASFVVAWNAGLWTKFAAIAVLAFAGTLALYEFGIRRWNPTRLVFGLRRLPDRRMASLALLAPATPVAT